MRGVGSVRNGNDLHASSRLGWTGAKRRGMVLMASMAVSKTVGPGSNPGAPASIQGLCGMGQLSGFRSI